MLKTTLVLVIEHSKPIPELTDIAAGRIYTLDGVEDVTAVAESFTLDQLAAACFGVGINDALFEDLAIELDREAT